MYFLISAGRFWSLQNFGQYSRFGGDILWNPALHGTRDPTGGSPSIQRQPGRHLRHGCDDLPYSPRVVPLRLRRDWIAAEGQHVKLSLHVVLERRPERIRSRQLRESLPENDFIRSGATSFSRGVPRAPLVRPASPLCSRCAKFYGPNSQEDAAASH